MTHKKYFLVKVHMIDGRTAGVVMPAKNSNEAVEKIKRLTDSQISVWTDLEGVAIRNKHIVSITASPVDKWWSDNE